MTDFWSFLLQTLTASGAAVLVLAAKAMFRDKLTPRWQFASWGLVGLVLLIPAGISGRYALVNWPFLVEAAKSSLTGEYGTLTQVIAPIPLPFFKERTSSVVFWLYAVYVAGVIVCLARYAISYLQLRLALKNIRVASGRGEKKQGYAQPDGESPTVQERVDDIAMRHHLPSCRVTEVEGLSSAFVCGVFHPILVLPAEDAVDEKVILHELLHLKHHDVLWGLLICLFRCIHWCNPLLWVCADMAGNDLEARCDQRVLERLSGEERRDYGRILLSMADGKYAKTPGTSSVANGGRNIRRRIKAIARFKKYPAGMGLVSACILLILFIPFAAGTKPEMVSGKGSILFDDVAADMARARIAGCTTYAGAFDTYAKAVLSGNIPYRAMCTTLAGQDELAAAYREGKNLGSFREFALPAMADAAKGYQIYNLVEAGDDVYEGLLVLQLSGQPEDNTEGEEEISPVWFAVQYVRVEKQDGRWAAFPQENFRAVQGDDEWDRIWPNSGVFPAWYYEDSAGDFLVRLKWQTASAVESGSQDMQGIQTAAFLTEPQPDGIFSVSTSYKLSAIYTGEPENKSRYTRIASSGYLVWDKKDGQGQQAAGTVNSGWESRTDNGFETGSGSGGEAWGSSSDGSSWGSKPLEEGWEDEIFLGGGGTNGGRSDLPDCYIMEFYLNGSLAAELTLELVEGGVSDE